MSYSFLSNAGIIVPDTADILDEVTAEYTTAFGSNLVVEPNTPQGVLITAETQSRIAVLTNNAAVANQINPNVAEGVFLDAIWALTGGSRSAGTPTRVSGVSLNGQPSTLIPAGSIAQTLDGLQFTLDSGVILDGAGSGSGNFTCVVNGQIVLGANDLNVIGAGVLGWESVDNPNAGISGSNLESDQEARLRRVNTLALQGYGTAEAITSRLYGITSVKSVSFRENFENYAQTIDGVLMSEHSIWACVDGGSDAEVAQALLDSKSSGSAYNGAESVSVSDPFSGQSYIVNFDRPTEVPVMVQIIAKAGTSTVDPVSAIKDAILKYTNGLLAGETGFTLGAAVSSFELAGAVNVSVPSTFVTDCQVSVLDVAPTWVYLLPIALYEKATLQSANINVTLI